MNKLFRLIASLVTPARFLRLDRSLSKSRAQTGFGNGVAVKATKRHRRCYFWPVYRQFGYESQAAIDKDRRK